RRAALAAREVHRALLHQLQTLQLDHAAGATPATPARACGRPVRLADASATAVRRQLPARVDAQHIAARDAPRAGRAPAARAAASPLLLAREGDAEEALLVVGGAAATASATSRAGLEGRVDVELSVEPTGAQPPMASLPRVDRGHRTAA